jgi:hypothetical protein
MYASILVGIHTTGATQAPSYRAGLFQFFHQWATVKAVRQFRAIQLFKEEIVDNYKENLTQRGVQPSLIDGGFQTFLSQMCYTTLIGGDLW